MADLVIHAGISTTTGVWCDMRGVASAYVYP